jgi:flagellar biosynthesis protein FlhG
MSQICPIGGGKGGSGKSFITANLGVLLAKKGKRVLLVDLDLGGSNLHTFLSLRNPKLGLNDFLNKAYKNLDEVAVPTAIPNLSLISSTNCSHEIGNLFHAQKLKIIRAINDLSYDYTLLDLGAGTIFNILDFLVISNKGLFIITPEPTSIENTFQFIKAVYLRKIKQVLKQRVFSTFVKKLQAKTKNTIIRSPMDLLEIVAKQDSKKGKLLQAELEKLQFKFIINQFRKETDVTMGNKIEKLCNKHFFAKFQFLGNIRYDERVHDSIYSRSIYMSKYPYSITAVDLQNVAGKITKTHEDLSLKTVKSS